jgi:pimeloyl-ACP methyl ester carboxylesterase
MTNSVTDKGRLHGGADGQERMPLALRVMRLLFSRLGRLFPRLMARWAYHLWFRTRRYPEWAAGRRAAETAERETLRVDGVPVAVYCWGDGPIVLFVHGWSGRATQVAAFIRPLRQAGYRVMAVDAPGHGETPGKRTNILEWARVLQAFVQRYGPVHSAITHSFGGMVLAFAMARGLAVGRVVCIAAPARLEFLVERFAGILAMPHSVVANLKARLDTPALVIHDEDDAGVPWQHGRQIAGAWSGAQFVKTQGLGHSRILRHPAVIEQVVAFIGA